MKTVNGVATRIVKTPNSDLKVVNSARVSFAKEVTEMTEKDERLIKYLAEHKHWTPFSHCRETFALMVEEDDFAEVSNFFTTWLTQADKASMVQVYDPSENALYTRTSIYGWANLLNKIVEFNKNERVCPFVSVEEASIYNYLKEKYPVSTKYLINEEATAYYEKLVADSTELFDLSVAIDHPDFIDLTVYESVPIFVARQRFKHMIGTTYNEVSRRYVSDEPIMYFPDVWRGKHDTAKQGSTDDPAEFMDPKQTSIVKRAMAKMVTLYNEMVANGVCPEQARMILPQAMMTEYYVTANLTAHNRFITQRLDPHAQKEIRDLAKPSQENIKELIGIELGDLVNG